MRVFLGSYTSDGGGGIGVGAFERGELTVERWSDVVADPSWLALSPDGATLYAVSECNGTVNSLRADDLSLLATEPTGAAPAHLVVAGEHLFVAHYGGGSVAAHPLLPDGRVGPATVHRHAPDGAHAHQFVLDPTRRWALVPDLGLDAVFVYALKAGELQEHARVPFPAGSGPRHVVFAPDGATAHVAAELASTVTACHWADGVLEPGEPVSTRPAGASGANYPGGIAISPDGRHLYVGNRGDDTTAVLRVTNGVLVAAPGCGGVWPRHTGLDPSGRWLFSANQRSGDVVWFEVEDGIPGRQQGRLAAPAVSHVCFG